MKYLNLALVLILAITIIFSGCVSEKKQEIKLGAVFALSGDASYWGVEELAATRLAIKEHSDLNINLIIEDSQSDNANTLKATQKLISSDNINLILGPTWGDSFFSAIKDISNNNKILFISSSSAIESLPEDHNYFFSTYYPQNTELQKIVDFIKDNNYNNVVLLNDQDMFNTTVTNLLESKLKEDKIKINKRIQIPLNSKDYKSIVLDLKNENPDLVYVNLFNPGDYGELIKLSKELDFDIKLLSTASAQNDFLITNYPNIIENNFYYSYPNQVNEKYKLFEERYFKEYNKYPETPIAVNAYDAANVLLDCLSITKTIDSYVIRNCLLTNEFDAYVANKIKFNIKGQIETADFTIKTVKDNKFVKYE